MFRPAPLPDSDAHDRQKPVDASQQLSWDDLRIIKMLSETGSRSVAAAKLGINVSTVSRRVAQAEQALGVTLFDRRRSGYKLTAEGMELRALGERIELDVVSVARRVSRAVPGPSGTLRITTSDSLLLYFLTPIIADFKTRNATTTVEVMVGNDALDLARDEADIALRATRNPPESLIGRKLAAIAWAPYGCEAQFRSQIPAAAGLYDREWVSYTGQLSCLKANSYIDSRVASGNIAYRSDSVTAVSAAIAAGLGVGFLPCMLGDIMPGLVRVGSVAPELDDELWLLTHPDIKKSRRVQAFMSFCADAAARRKDLIEGRSFSPHRIPS